MYSMMELERPGEVKKKRCEEIKEGKSGGNSHVSESDDEENKSSSVDLKVECAEEDAPSLRESPLWLCVKLLLKWKVEEGGGDWV